MPGLKTQNGRHRNPSDRFARRRLAPGRAGMQGLFAIPLAAALLWFGSGAALGQPTPAHTELDDEATALFQQVLKDPTNVEANFRYAEAAVKLGNYEGAISALERLLLYNPNYPGVKLQLAELYIRLGSYTAARAYLTEVEEGPDATAETRAQVKALRAQIEHATSPSNFAANAFVGMRYQSNASAEPAGADLIAGGVPLTLSAISLHRNGFDSFFGGNLTHSYDFGAATLESNALVYYSKQLEFGVIDSAAVEVNSGPRFDIGGHGADRIVSLRPYALASEVLLGNSQFLWTAGAGLGAEAPIADRVGLAGFYEYRTERFSNLTLVPTATDMNAGVHSVGATLAYQIYDNGTFGFQVSYAIDNARRSFASNDAFVLRASYRQSFALPAEFGGGLLSITPIVYRIYSWNGAPDPAVNPTVIANVQQWRLGVTGELTLTDNVAATAQVIREVVNSNLSADRSNNTQVIVGLHLAF